MMVGSYKLSFVCVIRGLNRTLVRAEGRTIFAVNLTQLKLSAKIDGKKLRGQIFRCVVRRFSVTFVGRKTQVILDHDGPGVQLVACGRKRFYLWRRAACQRC